VFGVRVDSVVGAAGSVRDRSFLLGLLFLAVNARDASVLGDPAASIPALPVGFWPVCAAVGGVREFSFPNDGARDEDGEFNWAVCNFCGCWWLSLGPSRALLEFDLDRSRVVGVENGRCDVTVVRYAAGAFHGEIQVLELPWN
jgi:hypothetical protein